ncbi:MAG: efflux RND transporter permease subunit [Rhodobacteraceae bacterium]|nr:efflux RND transporter permease subunit [Paracoccaceae bacterium]
MTGRFSGVIGYFTRHPTAANLLLVLMLLSGLAAAPQMHTQFLPDVEIDEVRVTVKWDGAGPEDVDAAIVAPLQPALLEVEGVAESSAEAQQGRARISLEFEPGWDMAQAQQDVQTAVEGITTLPEDSETPEVARRVWRERLTDVVISGPVGIDQLMRYTDDFVARLYTEGITRTTILGIADPEIAVTADMLSLIRHDVTLQQIASAIGADIDSLPAGTVDGANARVRTGTARRTADEVARIVLRRGADGSVLRIGDVAEVTRSATDRDRAYNVEGMPAVAFTVDRVAGGDALAIRDTVARVAAEFNASLPEGTSVELIRTRADRIAERLSILLDNGALGLGLVLLLLFLFLDARTALWVAAGIPVAMCAALAMMYGLGLSLNMVSLFGLIITLGIVVDDAIVVAEHADARARRLGEAPAVAAERAARRMALPVFTATITTIIAFWALTFVGGRFGTLIRDIPLTVIVVLAASLIECFLILPHHMAHALKHSAKEHWYDWPSRQVNRGFRWVRERAFRPLLGFAIRARYVVVSGAIALLVSQVVLLMSGEVPWRFFNSPERTSLTTNVSMVYGANREDTVAQVAEVKRAIDAVAASYEDEYGLNPVEFVLTEVGANAGRWLPGTESKDPDLLGGLTIELIDADDRPYTAFDFVARLREEVREMPLTETLSFRRGRSGPGGDSLDVSFFGADTTQLKAAAEELKARAGEYPEVSALEDDLSYDRVEYVLELTDRGAALGFTTEGLGQALRNRLNGIEAATFPAGPRSGAIRVEVPEVEKSADFLQGMLMRSPDGTYVPLTDLVTLRQQEGYSVLRRENGRRVVTVTGDISEDDPARAQEITETLREAVLPAIADTHGVSWYLGGLAEDERSFFADAQLGFMLCLAGIFLTLAWIFGSWWRPLTIMAIIPFGLIGAIWGHALWGVPMSMFTVVGLIGMSGIIINDSIVLVTTVDEYAKKRALVPAVIDATADRLRPVVLTTLTTVLGLAPLLYEGSQQAQFLRPTVIALVYGLGFGMLLVLLLVPALLVIGRDISGSLRAARRVMGQSAGLPIGPRLALGAFSAALLIWAAAVLLPAFGGWGSEIVPVVAQSRGSAIAVFAAGTAGLALLFGGGSLLFGRRTG